MREIRFDKIGFNVLADTHDVCDALCLKNGQLDEETKSDVSCRTLSMTSTNAVNKITLLFIAAE